MTPRRRQIVLPGALLSMVMFTACAPLPINEQGRDVKDLYDFFLIASAVIFVIVAGLILWSLIRYRAKPGDDELPSQFHSNLGLEVVWFAIPQILVVVLFVASAFVLGRVNEEPERPDLTVNVQAFRWGWRFGYEGTDVTITGLPEERATIALPVGRSVRFELTSRDVIHAFYVPRFLNKLDMIPGRTNSFAVTLEREGTFRGVCAEFCGLLHDRMTFTIRVVPEDEFQTWLSEQEGVIDGNG